MVQTIRMGFEPTRAEHNGLAVHHLNHSAKNGAKGSARRGGKGKREGKEGGKERKKRRKKGGERTLYIFFIYSLIFSTMFTHSSALIARFIITLIFMSLAGIVPMLWQYHLHLRLLSRLVAHSGSIHAMQFG